MRPSSFGLAAGSTAVPTHQDQVNAPTCSRSLRSDSRAYALASEISHKAWRCATPLQCIYYAGVTSFLTVLVAAGCSFRVRIGSKAGEPSQPFHVRGVG